jgi:amino acid transporter
VIALWDWGKKELAGFLNGALIFSVLSASNTSLYVASRTLYGLALDVPTTSRAGKILHSFSVVVPQTGVPARALIFSALAFIWLPFINLKQGYAVQYVGSNTQLKRTQKANISPQLVEIIQISSSVSLLIVWAALSLAYLRYYLWYVPIFYPFIPSLLCSYILLPYMLDYIPPSTTAEFLH